MSNPQTYARPIRLSKRSSQGVFVGLDPWSSATVVLAIGIVLLSVLANGFFGAVATAVLWVPLAVASFVPIAGNPAAKMGVLWMSKQLRHVVGATKVRYRPERPKVAATLNLPGRYTNVQLWESDGMACAYNPRDKTVSITAELEVEGFLMLDLPERYDLAQQWAAVLASFTQRSGIKRVSLQERTTPTTIEPARRHFEETIARRHVDPATAVASNYHDVMDKSEQYAVAHRNYITLTLDLVALQGQLRNLGGGQGAIVSLARVEASNVTSALVAAGLNVRAWLNAREWAALVRTALDPHSLATVQSRTGALAGVDPAAIGVMALEEPRGNNGVVLTENHWHSTMWIHEWPRSATSVGFVEPLVFARHPTSGEAVTHIFTIVLTPVGVKKALKRIRDEKKVWRGNQRVKARRNEADSAEDRADWEALEEQEQSIVDGHGEYHYGGYLTVTADSEEKLAAAIAGARNAMSRQGMEGQILYCQQAEALLLNALPLGLGLK